VCGSGVKSLSKFQEWQNRKISAVTVVNPSLPIVDTRPTKYRSRVTNVERLMYRGTERSKQNDQDLSNVQQQDKEGSRSPKRNRGVVGGINLSNNIIINYDHELEKDIDNNVDFNYDKNN